MPNRDIIQSAMPLLRDRYIFPDRAKQAADAIEARAAAGDYDDLDEVALGEQLTAQLHEICADKHLRVRPRTHQQSESLDPKAVLQGWLDGESAQNFGIARVERLAGNVGYIDLHGVTDPSVGGAAIAAAMALVSGTHALIIDLRHNGGGSPDGAIFWCSYLFPDAETHLNNIFDAESGITKQFWTLSYVPGARYLDRPVYVLVSGRTFSGGEEICYNLQAQGRATLIGETTRGGAHPTMPFPLSATMEITVPVARSINPITGTNWEGTGVVPDIAVPAEEAYELAYGKALRHVLSVTTTSRVADEARTALAAREN